MAAASDAPASPRAPIAEAIAPASSPVVECHVNGISGLWCTVSLPIASSVGVLKEDVAKRMGMSREEVFLSVDGRKLRNKDILSDVAVAGVSGALNFTAFRASVPPNLSRSDIVEARQMFEALSSDGEVVRRKDVKAIMKYLDMCPKQDQLESLFCCAGTEEEVNFFNVLAIVSEWKEMHAIPEPTKDDMVRQFLAHDKRDTGRVTRQQAKLVMQHFFWTDDPDWFEEWADLMAGFEIQADSVDWRSFVESYFGDSTMNMEVIDLLDDYPHAHQGNQAVVA
eukprot:TRINITY_DN8476_c4_g1_i1.p1 TRINITY_DN8476_c4_g1~~TRINITY_DN8476_c4_g1_i1.p1  ORF type:complete len:294 (+),score=69.90 TRINITY_DN8476_c4_g1_i1:42-884(+)